MLIGGRIHAGSGKSGTRIDLSSYRHSAKIPLASLEACDIIDVAWRHLRGQLDETGSAITCCGSIPRDDPCYETDMKAIIHIGLPKAGSTSLQRWIYVNRADLESNGVYILAPKESLARGWKLIPASMYVGIHELGFPEQTIRQRLGKPPYEGEVENIYKSLILEFECMRTSRPRIFLASCERIIWLNESQIIAFDKLLSHYFESRTYIAYIRNTVDYYISWYSQKLYNNNLPRSMNLHEYLQYCTSDTTSISRESYWHQLFIWEGMFGDNFNVRLLESEWLLENDLYKDFSSLIGVPVYSKPARANESFAAEYIEYVMKINELFGHSIPIDTRRKALNFLQHYSIGKPKLSISEVQAHAIRMKIHDQEEKIRRKFFQTRKSLYSEKSRAQEVLASPLTVNQLAAIDAEIQKAISPTKWDQYRLAPTHA